MADRLNVIALDRLLTLLLIAGAFCLSAYRCVQYTHLYQQRGDGVMGWALPAPPANGFGRDATDAGDLRAGVSELGGEGEGLMGWGHKSDHPARWGEGRSERLAADRGVNELPVMSNSLKLCADGICHVAGNVPTVGLGVNRVLVNQSSQNLAVVVAPDDVFAVPHDFDFDCHGKSLSLDLIVYGLANIANHTHIVTERLSLSSPLADNFKIISGGAV